MAAPVEPACATRRLCGCDHTNIARCDATFNPSVGVLPARGTVSRRPIGLAVGGHMRVHAAHVPCAWAASSEPSRNGRPRHRNEHNKFSERHRWEVVGQTRPEDALPRSGSQGDQGYLPVQSDAAAQPYRRGEANANTDHGRRHHHVRHRRAHRDRPKQAKQPLDRNAHTSLWTIGSVFLSRRPPRSGYVTSSRACSHGPDERALFPFPLVHPAVKGRRVPDYPFPPLLTKIRMMRFK